MDDENITIMCNEISKECEKIHCERQEILTRFVELYHETDKPNYGLLNKFRKMGKEIENYELTIKSLINGDLRL